MEKINRRRLAALVLAFAMILSVFSVMPMNGLAVGSNPYCTCVNCPNLNCSSISGQCTCTYAVTVNPSLGGSATATAGAVGIGAVPVGFPVTLTANASEGYTFTRWIFDGTLFQVSDNTSPMTFNMPGGPVTVTPVFTQSQSFDISLVQPSIGGSVSVFPTSATAMAGATVTLTASLASGYVVESWNVTAANITVTTTPTGANSATFIMPNANVTVTPIFSFGYSINNVTPVDAARGTASASHTVAAESTTVTLTATPRTDNGYVLSGWTVTRTDNNSVITTSGTGNTATFTMPNSNVTYQANFSQAQIVTIKSSNAALGIVQASTNTASVATTTTADNRTLTAAAGTVVNLTATPATPANANATITFLRWEVTPSTVTVTDTTTGSSAVHTASFSMPTGNVEITAVFRSNTVTVGGVSITYEQTSGDVKLDMPPTTITGIIDATRTAGRNMVLLDLSDAENATRATLPREALTQVAAAGYGVEFDLPQGKVTLNNTVAGSVASQAGASADVSVALFEQQLSGLTAAQRNEVRTGDVVFTINMSAGTGAGQAITTFDGNLSATVPYTGQIPVAVWHLSSTGQLEKLTNTSYSSTAQTVTFSTGHLSEFVIGADNRAPTPPTPPPIPDTNPFADVLPQNWFYQNVLYAYHTNLMTGTSTEPMLFSPSMPLSRAMLVTILHRYVGAPSVAGMPNPFTDVPAGQYYTSAVIWAEANGVVEGSGGGLFSPNSNITRQDFAVILHRFMTEYLELNIPVTLQFTMFADEDQIASYAATALQVLYNLEVISGTGGNRVEPRSNATRAEAAAMLHRFITRVLER